MFGRNNKDYAVKFYIFACNINDITLVLAEEICDVCEFNFVDSYFTPERIVMIRKHLIDLHSKCFAPTQTVHHEIFVLTEHEYNKEKKDLI